MSILGKTAHTVVVLSALAGLTQATIPYGLNILNSATTDGLGSGGFPSCIPTCSVYFSTDDNGEDCIGRVSWLGACGQWTVDNGTGAKADQDVDGCGGGWYMTWHTEQDNYKGTGASIVSIYNLDTSEWADFEIGSCDTDDSTGGGQCTEQGGCSITRKWWPDCPDGCTNVD